MTRLSRRAYLAAGSGGLASLAGCSGLGLDTGTGVTVEATSPSLRDGDPQIVVRGLDAGARVRLETSAPGRFRSWRARATFRADGEGVVRVSEQAPESGSYEGVNPAGLLWSMAPEGDSPEPWPPGRYTARLVVRRDDVAVAETALVRRRVEPDVSTRWVTAEDVVGLFATRQTDEPRPGIMALHGSTGSPTIAHAEMFASHGFPTLAVKYFGGGGAVPSHLEGVPLSYFDRAADWLRAQPTVRDGPLGVYGFSRGGEGALFVAAYADWVGAVVADAPSGIAWQGLRADGRTAQSGAWALDGEPHPYVSFESCSPGYTDSGLRRDAAFYECGLERADEPTIRAATFPLENVEGPILCVTGADDGVLPAARLTRIAGDRLRERGVADRFTHLEYPAAGHRIPIPHVPTYGLSTAGRRLIGGTPEGIARAAADAWPRVLATFEQGLD